MSRSWLFLVLVLAVSFFARFYELGLIPPWNVDDGENLSIAWNLANGRLQWLAVRYFFVPRLPLFYLASGVAVGFRGYNIVAVRIVSALCGFLATALLYFVGKRVCDTRVGLLSSLLFAVYPLAVLHNRVGFTHNLFMLLALASFYCVLRYDECRRALFIYIGCGAAALALISEVTAVSMFVFCLVYVYFFARRELAKMLVLMAVPPVSLFFLMLSFDGTGFLQDIGFYSGINGVAGGFSTAVFVVTGVVVLAWFFGKPVLAYLLRLTEAGRSPQSKAGLLVYLLSLLVPLNGIIILGLLAAKSDFSGYDFEVQFNFLFIVGMVGCALMPERREKRLMLLAAACMMLPFFLIPATVHRLIPLYPFLTVGAAYFIVLVYDTAKSLSGKFMKKSVVFTLLLAVSYAPLAGYILHSDASIFSSGAGVNQEYETAAYINDNTKEGDSVTAPAQLAHLIKADVSDIHQTVAYDMRGGEMPTTMFLYFSNRLPEDRFLFNCSHRRAAFVVVDEYDFWIMEKYAPAITDDIRSWKAELRTGRYTVYRNPAFDREAGEAT